MALKLIKTKIKIVLAAHGSPPKDFPKQELIEYFSLNMRLEHAPQSVDDKTKARIHELDQKIRKWPRTKENDPFFFSSMEIANNIAKKLALKLLQLLMNSVYQLSKKH